VGLSGHLEKGQSLIWIPEAFDRAMSMKVLQKDVEQVIPVVLARASYEKRLLEDDKAG
jgi:hypothetical protein